MKALVSRTSVETGYKEKDHLGIWGKRVVLSEGIETAQPGINSLGGTDGLCAVKAL